MIDLHAHILPGLDDGPREMEEAVAMCRTAQEDGIRALVAVAHTLNGVYRNPASRIKEAVVALQNRLEQEGLDVRVLPGADVHVDPEIVGLIERGEVMTVNDTGRYVMLELPEYFALDRIKQLFFDLQVKGIVPIVSHPERNGRIRQDLGLLRELVQGGAVSQVTAMSLTGDFGAEIQAAVERLLERRLVHIIASDAHSRERRPPALSRAVERAAQIVGPEEARHMVSLVPQRVLDGEAFEPPPPREPAERKKGLKRLKDVLSFRF